MKTNNSFEIPQGRTSGVYAIINTSKKKCYIGESTDIEYRCRNHLSNLKNGKHVNKQLQADFNKGDIFKVVVLANVKKDLFKDKMKAAEAFFVCCLRQWKIKLYNSPKINYSENFFIRAGRANNQTWGLIKGLSEKEKAE